MDYFFVQVEERDNPKLKGLPVAIGSRKYKRGVLSTSNYIARKYGVRSAIPTAMALKLCPDLVLISGHMEKYKKVSEEVFEIFKSFSKNIQVVSIDEAYIDVTDCSKFNNNAIAIAEEIRRRIFGKTGLTASAGVSYNKLLAKIASDLNKPNGLSVIRPSNVEKMISHFSVSKIWGVGKVTQERMKQKGIFTFGDLQQYKKIELIHLFGDFGVTLFEYCRGIDHREVKQSGERKSLSIEHTYMEDIKSKSEVIDKIKYCLEELNFKIKKYNQRKVKNIHLKIKYNDFTQTTVEQAFQGVEFKLEQFIELLNRRVPSEEFPRPIRLLGIGVKFFCTKEVQGQVEMNL